MAGIFYTHPLTFCGTSIIIFNVPQKVGDDLSPRTGRPKSENPKSLEVKARIDAETAKKLQEHCKKHNKTRTDVVREGIELVLRQEK